MIAAPVTPARSGHANTVAGVDQRVGGRGVNTAAPTCRQYMLFGTNVKRVSPVSMQMRSTPTDSAILVFHQIDRHTIR